MRPNLKLAFKYSKVVLTEIWLSSGDEKGSDINDATPNDYMLRDIARAGCGGGVGMITKKSQNHKITTLRNFNSFEYLNATLKSPTKLLRVIIL